MQMLETLEMASKSVETCGNQWHTEIKTTATARDTTDL